MNFISLFSGVGGIDLGLERAGMSCVAQVEIDQHASGVLAHHWPAATRLTDVRHVNARSVPRCDLLAGGSPCQGFSVAGQRAGLADDRSGLWWEFARIIGELRPSWVLVENVDGLLSSANGRDFRAVVGSMVKLGYCVGWRVFDAQYFGLAQHRERVFLVGHLGTNPRRPAEILFESACLPRGAETRRKTGQDVAGSLGGGAGNRGWSDDTDRCGAFIPIQAATLTNGANGKAGRRREDDVNLVAHTVRPGGERWKADGSDNKVVASTLQASAGHHGHSSPRGDGSDNLVVSFDWQSGGDARGLDPKTKTSALNRSQVPAVFNGGVRRLMPIECERLQGFPDHWTAISNGKPQSDSKRYQQLGNAAPVPVVEWIGRRILEAA